MASDSLYMAIKTIGLSALAGRKPCSLDSAIRHNRREIQAELGADGHINPRLTHRNLRMAGPESVAGVLALAKELQTAAGIDADRLRRDHVQAFELVFSLAPDAAIDTAGYFGRCLAWSTKATGLAVLSADAHFDEAAPHLHVLLSPVKGGQMTRSQELTAKAQTLKLCESFWREVAGPAGLRRDRAQLRGSVKAAAVAVVLDRLGAPDAGPMLSVWPLVVAAVSANPLPWLEKLGIDPADLKAKPIEFSGPKTNSIEFENAEPKSIEFAEGGANGVRGERTLSCVEFASSPPSDSVPSSPFADPEPKALGAVELLPDGFGCPVLLSHVLPRSERLEVARDAQTMAIARHGRAVGPSAGPVDLADAGRVVDRTDAHDLAGWLL